MRYHRIFTGIIIVFCLLNITHFLFAEDVSIHQANLNFVERITRFEEGQKAIVNEMRTRFEAVDKRFEILEKSIDKRFESIDQRFELVDKRFDSLVREMNQRFESIEKRFESFEKRLSSLENQMTSMSTFIFTMLSAVIALIVGLIGFIVWDRKSVFEKMEKLFQSHVETYHAPQPAVIKEKVVHVAGDDTQNPDIVDQLTNEGYQLSKNMQEKIRDVFKFFNEIPEMRPNLQTV